MTKERFAELVLTLNERELEEIIDAINQNTFEWGWNGDFDDHPLIKECWQHQDK